MIESSEAFAAQACTVSADLGFPADRVNPNGGAVALGHPVGASGAIILVKLAYDPATFRCLYTLTVDNAGRRTGRAPFGPTSRRDEVAVQILKQA